MGDGRRCPRRSPLRGTVLIAPLLLCLLSTFVQPASARDTGTLTGSVRDAQTGVALRGVNVVLEGTRLGATTGAGGTFEISRVDAGAYTAVASMIGYATARDTVTVTVGARVAIAFELRPAAIQLGRILVQADRSFSAASSSAVRQFDLQIRPKRSTQQMLQIVPGLFIAQHAGGGKAEQLFLRGFDNDHGTDVAISVDGMPVNMVSQAHGQGYADLHFMIPEVIESMEVYKGPYFAEYGNLANAGQIVFRTRDRLDGNAMRLEWGAFDTARYTMLYQLPLGSGPTAYFAGNLYRTDGPFDSPQDLHRLNLFTKICTPLASGGTVTLEGGGFSSAWNASGQIPKRAVDAGSISRWGAIDDSEGGSTARQNAVLTYDSSGAGDTDFFLQGYFTDYSFKLFSDFTFFLQDPVYGDMVEQTERRRLSGLNSKYTLLRGYDGFVATTTLGGGYRGDDIDTELWQAIERRRYWPLVQASIRERNFFLWGQQELRPASRLRLVLGLRADYFTFQVEDQTDLESRGIPPLTELVRQVRSGAKPLHIPLVQPHASGYAQQAIFSPKANLVYGLFERVDLFANFGTGFHSNDARSVILGQSLKEQVRLLRDYGLTEGEIAAVMDTLLHFDLGQQNARVLPRTVGGELGLRTRVGRRLNLGTAAWWIDVADEFVYAGDVGELEQRGRTRRLGLDLEARLQLFAWLWGDLDLNLARGRLRDAPADADRIPLAPLRTSTGGLTLRHPRGWEGSLRYRYMAARPASADGGIEATGYTVFDADLTWRRGAYKVDLIAENLLDTEWNEAQFAALSRLPGEGISAALPAPGPELHFTPGNPFNLRLGVGYYY